VTRFWRFAAIGVLFAASVVVSYTAYTATFRGTSVTADSLQGEAEAMVYTVATPEEASRAVGFTLGEPAFLPEGFQRKPSIMIIPRQTRPSAGKPNPLSVVTVYKSEEHPSAVMVLTQNTWLDGIGNSEKVQIGGTEFQRNYQPVKPGRDEPFVVYFWKSSGVAFTLQAYVGEGLTEDEAVAVANSVR
jgi:hypothetical protein